MAQLPITSPLERSLIGLVVGVLIAIADAAFSEFGLGRTALIVILTPLLLWLLTPIARLSGRHHSMPDLSRRCAEQEPARFGGYSPRLASGCGLR